jgi:hypothetical protein
MAILKHLLRTLIIIVVGVIGLWCFLWTSIKFGVNPYVVVFTPVVMGLAFAYFSARWHPYWAPISKQAMRLPWTREDGTAMETCVEIAIFAAGYTNKSVYRVSIYESLTRKRTHRRLIGDGVTTLGRFEPGVWFYIHDRFYPRIDGLVCLDVQTCEWRFHQPKSVIELDEDESLKCPRGFVNVIWNGTATQLDLRKIPNCPAAF